MENENENENIIDNTLNLMSDTIGAFDNTLGKVPLYKSGHDVGSALSKFIDKLVDTIPDRRRG